MDTGRDVPFNTAQQIDGIKTQMQLAAAKPQDSEPAAVSMDIVYPSRDLSKSANLTEIRRILLNSGPIGI